MSFVVLGQLKTNVVSMTETTLLSVLSSRDHVRVKQPSDIYDQCLLTLRYPTHYACSPVEDPTENRHNDAIQCFVSFYS